jgi:heat shock protein HslJ
MNKAFFALGVVPDDPSRYTIEFAADGSVAVRADCNRGFGTYAEAAGALTIEVSGLTRAQCEEGSLSDEYLRDLVDVRTYVIEGGALYLDLMADAGTLRHGQG